MLMFQIVETKTKRMKNILKIMAVIQVKVIAFQNDIVAGV